MPAADPARVGEDPADGSDGRVAGQRLLVVDDEPGIRLVLGRGLARYGYKVFLADSGAEALRLLRDDLVVDAVVTDITMPVMTGTELAAEILNRYPGVPVLFVTGSTAPPELLADPLVDLVEKPVRIAHIQNRLGELIARAAARRGLNGAGGRHLDGREAHLDGARPTGGPETDHAGKSSGPRPHPRVIPAGSVGED